MARPTRSLKMARTAQAAMLAAVEVYNKTTFSYREETFCLLIVNAWEILLKARIVQKHGNDVNSIRLRRDARHYIRDDVTGDVRTIGLERALGEADVPNEVRENVRGLYDLRNDVQHRGFVAPAFRREVLLFGTAAVQNMVAALSDWFDESMDRIYLLPVGFVGTAVAVSAASQNQRELLQRLHRIASGPTNTASGYHIAAEIKVNIHASRGGGGTIGITDDPNAPEVQLTEEDWLALYPATYKDDLIPELKDRYPNFKMGTEFNQVMKEVKADPRCTHVRRLDPENPRSGKKEFYNVDEVCRRHLDALYVR